VITGLLAIAAPPSDKARRTADESLFASNLIAFSSVRFVLRLIRGLARQSRVEILPTARIAAEVSLLSRGQSVSRIIGGCSLNNWRCYSGLNGVRIKVDNTRRQIADASCLSDPVVCVGAARYSPDSRSSASSSRFIASSEAAEQDWANCVGVMPNFALKTSEK